MLETMFGRVELAIFSGQAEHFSSFLHDNLLNFNIFPQVVILVDVVYIIQLIDLLDAEDEHPILLKRKFLAKFIQKFFQDLLRIIVVELCDFAEERFRSTENCDVEDI